MEFLKSWIVNIVITMVFVAFVEILIPRGSMRRYVSFVLGLLVMIVILNPLLNVVIRDFDMAGSIISTAEAINLRDLQLKAENIKQGQQEGIVRLYKNRLEEEMKRHVSEMYDGDVRVEVNINEDYGSEDFGRVEGVKVVIRKRKEEKDSAVQKVEVKVDISKQQETAEVNSHRHINGEIAYKIMESLAQTYGLQTTHVQVVMESQ